MKLSFILLAGGKSERMGLFTPKPFLPLAGKPVALHSFDLFAEFGEEIIVVAPKEHRSIFPKNTLFAEPGERRQDSVQNGLIMTTGDLICIHDSARPFLEKHDLLNLIKAAKNHGAVTLASPVTSTIKQMDQDMRVIKTLNRDTLVDIQTPQIIPRETLLRGFNEIGTKTVTDDVSLVEALNEPVTIVLGSPNNIKITYQSDLPHAKI